MPERANQTIFDKQVGSEPDPLVHAADNVLDVRVPLRTMGIADAKPTKITIGDAQWPKSAVFSLDAQQYR